ncbi:4271_t:CDS:1, partial [Cetraspora pellucida]
NNIKSEELEYVVMSIEEVQYIMDLKTVELEKRDVDEVNFLRKMNTLFF